jgi:hypothetical protein
MRRPLPTGHDVVPERFGLLQQGIALALLGAPAAAIAQEQLWLAQIGTPQHDRGVALAPGPEGGVFVAGNTRGSLGGPNAGGDDIFLAAYSRMGNQLWIRQLGTPAADTVAALAPDGSGGVYIGGTTGGSLGGPHAGDLDAFLARYDASGQLLWTRQLGTAAADQGRSLLADDAGGVFITGFTAGDLGGPNSGGSDAFLARYDSDGNQLLLRQYATASLAAGYVVADGTGGIIIAGMVQGAARPFIAGYAGDGTQLWLREIVQMFYMPWHLAIDTTVLPRRIFMVGEVLIDSYSSYWVACFDAAGQEQWVREGSIALSSSGLAAAGDSAGGVLIAGTAQAGWAHYPPPDVLIVHHNGAGDLTWHHRFGGQQADIGTAILLDPAAPAPAHDKVFVAGYTYNALSGAAAGQGDVFVARYGEICYANCDGSTVEPILNVEDFACFINELTMAKTLPPQQQLTHYANCDQSTTVPVLNVEDFTCFINAFAAGCG